MTAAAAVSMVNVPTTGVGLSLPVAVALLYLASVLVRLLMVETLFTGAAPGCRPRGRASTRRPGATQ